MNLNDVTNAPIYNLIVIKISFINLKKTIFFIEHMFYCHVHLIQLL